MVVKIPATKQATVFSLAARVLFAAFPNVLRISVAVSSVGAIWFYAIYTAAFEAVFP